MLSIILTLDHRRLENLIGDFINNPSSLIYEEIRRSFINHVYWEEEFLFEKIQDSTSLAIIRGLETEHGSLWILLDQVKNALDGNDFEKAKEKMMEFMRVLLEHDGAEEGSVYQQLEALSDEEQANLILEEIKLATPPAGWKCRALS